MTTPDCRMSIAPPSSQAGIALVAVLLGAAFLFIEHDPYVSLKETYAPEGDEMENSVASGSTVRQLAVFAIGGVGLALLARRTGYPLRFRDPLAIIVLLYLSWCAASVLWSENTALTAKRLIVLALCFVAALGMVRQFRPRQFNSLVLVVLAAYCAMGLAAELALGTFRPWMGDYRFAGTVHPNSQGLYCAALSLALGVRAGWVTPQKRRYLAALAVTLVFLLLTKSRSACVGLAVALTTVTLPRIPVRRQIPLWIGASCVLSFTLLVLAIQESQIFEKTDELLLMGRTEGADTLSGRIPLWTELLEYIRERPITGYGYDSFWSPDHIAELSQRLEWAIQSAHNGYLETALNVGLVGGVLLTTALAAAIVRVGRWFLSGQDEGNAFILGTLLFGATCSFMESGLLQPVIFLPFITFCGIIRAAFCQTEEIAP